MMINSIVPSSDYVVVIGGMNMDIFGMPHQKVISRDSNPGEIGMTVGGVGQNIAQNLAHLDVPTYLITVYGDDYNSSLLQQSCEANDIHLDYAAQIPGARSSTYMYITDEEGDMLVGVNDMAICENISPAFLKPRLDFINGAKACLIDANLEKETIDWLGHEVTVPIFADTVSVTKATHFEDILDKIYTLKPNALEASLLTGVDIHSKNSAMLAARILLNKGVQNVFISLGAQGILCATMDKMLLIHPFETQIVNANGAGDCGMAAITWSYFDDPTRHLGRIGRIAQAASSIALESPKSVPDITVDQIMDKLDSMTMMA
ncbi:PfkB family carbohydrate kinase [Loigolactobacillus rennini]|uniref:Kinase, PfkB family n=1 Tax=Loigolactobacillus rennini DSM 20253 TaxID=1423796 RepID=A0A0R2D5N3_9LACO|nr:PfkB family carbohydrate kinase [Loigolactobacillus rennini]KRM95654.1 kinase, PfkB family [Loigolactobacillus rennini DSM 20253]